MFDLVSEWIAAAGAIGVFGLMVLENVFPPIPSELVMPLAGFQAAEGGMSLWAVIGAGIAGSVAGALPWYYAGRILGRERLLALAARHGMWLTMEPADVERAVDWFVRHGRPAVFFGRMLPGARTLISVPAGLARMPMLPFLALTALGSAVWVGVLTAAGYVLRAEYDRVEAWINPATNVLVIGVLGLYVFRLARLLLRRRRGV